MPNEYSELILSLKNLNKNERAFIVSRACLRVWPIAYFAMALSKRPKSTNVYNIDNIESLLLAFRTSFGLFLDTDNLKYDSLLGVVMSRLFHRLEGEIRNAKRLKIDQDETTLSFYKLLAISCQYVIDKESFLSLEYDFLHSLENLSLLTLILINDIEQIDIEAKWQLILQEIYDDIAYIMKMRLISVNDISGERSLWNINDSILLNYSDKFLTSIEKLPKSWSAWSDWYTCKLIGKHNDKLYAGISKAYEFEEIWEGRSNSINKIIMKFIEEENNISEELSNKKPPEIPDKKPSSLIIEWVDGKLVSINANGNSSLGPDKFDEAKQALKEQFNGFLDALSSENADTRFLNFATDLSNHIPDSNSSNSEIFSFGHKLNILKSYSSTINEECSSLTGALFQSLIMAYDDTVKQIPSWNEFKRNSSIETLQGENTQGLLKDLLSFNEALSDKENSEFIDKTITSDFEDEIGDARKATQISEVANNSNYIAEVVQDLLYSAENIIKEISKKAVEYVKSLANKSAKKAVEEFDGEVVKGFGKLGKWSAKLIVFGLPAIFAKAYLLPYAIEHWAWLQPLINFLKSVPIFK